MQGEIRKRFFCTFLYYAAEKYCLMYTTGGKICLRLKIGRNLKNIMNAVVLDEVCKMNYYARQLNPFAEELPQAILDKHYLRKHGKNAYYGQK